ncbi:MAG: MurT ligase domain-containing protein [Synechococcales bacterium]|nr:MurT ligase domain-containing protein [Synechococcales bacterium]
MNRLLLIPIIWSVRLLVLLLKVTGRGAGTSLPGLLVGRYFPFAFAALVAQIPYIIVVTGTNGKTTSQTMLSAILEQVDDIRVLRNRAGANLSQGILSQLLRQASPWGTLDATHGIFEVEEATLPRIAQMLRPNLIAVTNLYRDQLDAYGEVDMTEKLIRDGIAQCPQASVVVNGDDPRTARLTHQLPNPTYFTSLPAEYAQEVPYEGQLHHLDPNFQSFLRATKIQINDDLTSDVEVNGRVGDVVVKELRITITSPGFFHVYNALTAITLAKLLQVSDAAIVQGFRQFQPAFGRGEVLEKVKGDKRVYYQILLVKNPASFSLNLDLLRSRPSLKILFAINDNTADSKDVSWLWDSQLERLNDAAIQWLMCTGIRAKDMKVRLKYALTGDRAPTLLQSTQVWESIREAIEQSFELAEDGDRIYVLPTYTAMLEFRKAMGKVLD